MSEWQTVKLGDILVQQEKSKMKAGNGLETGKFPFYTCSNELTKRLNESIYTGPALIFGTGGNASVHFCLGDFSTSTDCVVYKSKSDNVDLNLVNKYLRENIYLLENGFKGAGLKHISRDYILNLELPLPPLAEQKHIAAVLDKCSEVIALHKTMLEKYDTLIKSRFIEMFEDNPIENGRWKVEKLGNLVTVTSSKRIYAEEQSTVGVPFLRISDLVSKINGIETCDLHIPESKYEEFRKNGLVPKADDILITSRGTLGLCYIIQSDDKFYFQDGMITWLMFENHDTLLSVFLTHLFSVIFKKKIDMETNGATVKYISISDIKSLKIPLPPLALQQEFAAFVRTVDAQKSAVQKSLKKTETLYKSLMQEYFA